MDIRYSGVLVSTTGMLNRALKLYNSIPLITIWVESHRDLPSTHKHTPAHAYTLMHTHKHTNKEKHTHTNPYTTSYTKLAIPRS